MSDVNQLFEGKKEDLFATQQEQINENQQLQQGNVTIEQQKEKEDVLNTGFIVSAPKLKTKKNPNPKPEKVEEKKQAEEKYLDANKFDKSYADVRGDASKDLVAINDAMKEFFATEKSYEQEIKSEDKDLQVDAYEKLSEKLREVESMCNTFLKFRISFSKTAKERTAMVKQLRSEVRTRLAKYNVAPQPVVKEESKVKKGFKRLGDGIKRFFTERIPDGFKGIGRTIKTSFNDTFKTRTAGQFFKDAARDYIWGGIFRNAFNVVAGALLLPVWLGAQAYKGIGKAANAIAGRQVMNISKIRVGLPHPHLPSTWTMVHEAVAAEKERMKRKIEEGENETEVAKTALELVVNEKRAEKPFSGKFKLVGPMISGELLESGTAKYKTGVGYTNKQTRDSIIERANAEYNAAELWRKENTEDEDDDE